MSPEVAEKLVTHARRQADTDKGTHLQNIYHREVALAKKSFNENSTSMDNGH